MFEVLAARQLWCRPEESIRWLWPLKKEPGAMPYVLYRVSGLDAVGKRKTAGSALGKGLKAVGGFTMVVTVEGLLGPGDSDTNRTELSHAIVTGNDKGCLAARRLADFQPTNQETEFDGNLAWVLTDQRLGLLQFGGLGKTSWSDAVRDIFRSSSDKPSGVPDLTVRAEIPRAEITGLEKADYRIKREPVIGLRVTLSDGSSLDLTESTDRDNLDRLLDMAHGRE